MKKLIITGLMCTNAAFAGNYHADYKGQLEAAVSKNDTALVCTTLEAIESDQQWEAEMTNLTGSEFSRLVPDSPEKVLFNLFATGQITLDLAVNTAKSGCLDMDKVSRYATYYASTPNSNPEVNTLGKLLSNR